MTQTELCTATGVGERNKVVAERCLRARELPLTSPPWLPMCDRGREIADATWRGRGWICVQVVTSGTRSVGPSGMLQPSAARSSGRGLAAGGSGISQRRMHGF
jgi:hypothetical protein